MTDNDPALPWMERYPLALVLRRGDDEAPARLAAWLAQTAGKRLGFAQVATLFPEVRPDAVARQFLDVL